MELAGFLIDFILHVDKHLQVFVQNYGGWVYALLDRKSTRLNSSH